MQAVVEAPVVVDGLTMDNGLVRVEVSPDDGTFSLFNRVTTADADSASRSENSSEYDGALT